MAWLVQLPQRIDHSHPSTLGHQGRVGPFRQGADFLEPLPHQLRKHALREPRHQRINGMYGEHLRLARQRCHDIGMADLFHPIEKLNHPAHQPLLPRGQLPGKIIALHMEKRKQQRPARIRRADAVRRFHALKRRRMMGIDAKLERHITSHFRLGDGNDARAVDNVIRRHEQQVAHDKHFRSATSDRNQSLQRLQ